MPTPEGTPMRDPEPTSEPPPEGTPLSELLVDAIIFDMDGVVIDSGDVYARHWRVWAADHGLDYELHIRKLHPGRPPIETIRIVAPHLDPAAEAARFNATLAASTDADSATAMPGALELLPGLPADRWAIATSAARDMAGAWLRHVGLPVPTAFVAIEDVARGKPAPDPYLRAAKRLGVDPGRCLVVEDAPAGIDAAKAAGATVLAVLTSHAADELTAADHITAGLHTVSAAPDSGRLRVRWQEVELRG